MKRDDVAELAFRGLFCVIFLGLGGEHLFQDESQAGRAWVGLVTSV